MANSSYTSFKTDIMTGLYDMSSDPIYVSLVTDSYTFSAAHTSFTSHVQSSEATGSGYTAGGIALSGKSVTADSTYGKFAANNVSWDPVTITASGAVVYETGSSRLIAFIDFGQNQSATNGRFQITWHANGIVRLGDA
jgi:hypothetical protein